MGVCGGRSEGYLAGGGLEALSRAVPVWAAASGLDGSAFSRLCGWVGQWGYGWRAAGGWSECWGCWWR